MAIISESKRKQIALNMLGNVGWEILDGDPIAPGEPLVERIDHCRVSAEKWSGEALSRFKARRCATLADVQAWVADERQRGRGGEGSGQTPTNTDEHGQKIEGGKRSVPVREGPCGSVPAAALAANATLSLLNLCCHLLDRQLAAQAAAFEQEGGFTERLYRVRSAARRKQP